MRILSIETSCDETAVSLIEAVGVFPDATYTVLGNALFSQVDIHREYGGVFPSLAKREHAKTVIPMCTRALEEAGLLRKREARVPLTQEETEMLHEILFREPGLADALTEFAETYELPNIDLIAVTSGPGLEPALWVGINFAKAFAQLTGAQVIPAHHMEGHVLASVFNGYNLAPLQFPALSLLISGGHTQLVLMHDWHHYELVGETRDDAVGEAFDKVARLIGLPYPGGPEISRLARAAREKELPQFMDLPRPMLHSGDSNFSFSGLKTAVRYGVEGRELSDDEKAALARDFEDTVTEVLIAKTEHALEETNARSLILGGGVTANRYLRGAFEQYFKRSYPEVALHLPDPKLATDNSIMIALAGHAHAEEALDAKTASTLLVAEGNRRLSPDA